MGKTRTTPKPNYYSNKPCECCGSYHGFCKIKLEYFTDMEEYDIYPEDRADYECDGCKYFRNCDDSFIFEVRTRKSTARISNGAGSVKARGYIQTNLLSSSGQNGKGIMDTGEDPEDQYKFENAYSILLAWHGLSHNDTSSLNCPADAYLSDNMPCPFCHDGIGRAREARRSL